MDNWIGKRVVIIGAARQGTALARYLASRGARVVLNDRRPTEALEAARLSLSAEGASIEWVCGGHPLELLDGTDLVCISGGVSPTLPLVVEAQKRGIPLSNDSQVFMQAVPCPVVGITGSAGKTTTTTLVGRMAHAAAARNAAMQSGDWPERAWVGGNIGSPLIAFVDEMKTADVAVMELSSFQLELMTLSPQTAAVLNVTPNHLDRHASMGEYAAAKRRILDFQNPGDTAVLGRDDPGAWAMAPAVRGRLVSFGFSEPLAGQEGAFLKDGAIYLRTGREEMRVMPRAEIRLRGEHNVLNVMAACAIASAAGLPVEAMHSGVEGFTGVPHRLEYVRKWKGAAWYNDSIATAPERAMAAIRSFDEPLVLLAGGRDKNLPWEEFAELALRRVDHVILFGEAAPKIEQALNQARQPVSQTTLTRCAGLKEAVLAAANVVEEGDVVLLSPGGTSFDEFRDFEDRGEAFRKWVMELL
ncbi:MAG: UDP-N-acetylmuramoyl-L-alanine--D-glutamate ligase [Chloroflexota bacterium]|nr:MAG: UDP-N-acetylmuramoyl-L-alanine--D-glutamate ligase [Chloroflexota bacterium]